MHGTTYPHSAQIWFQVIKRYLFRPRLFYIQRNNFLQCEETIYFLTSVLDGEHGRMNYKDTEPYMSAFL